MRIFTSVSLLLLSLTLNAQSNGHYSDKEWEDYFMPGVGYKTYLPKNSAAFGVYHGVTTEFIIYARATKINSINSGPSRIKTYGNLSMMRSTNTEADDIFCSNVGINLSFESRTNRNYFIPFFGLEMGGIFQRNFSSFHFTPMTGIQVVSTKRMIFSLQGGYQYTVKWFDEYSGFSFGSTINLMLWE